MEAAVPLALGSASTLSAALRAAAAAAAGPSGSSGYATSCWRGASAAAPLRVHLARATTGSHGGEQPAGGLAGGSPPQEAVLRAISEISKTSGRYAKTTNLVIGGVETPAADWKQLDEKVNQYPMARGFTAIGEGGDDFVASMVVAVETVLQTPVGGKVRQRESAQGRYISVKIGPMRVESSEQVQAVYRAMRSDRRMRYFL
eukprot:SM000070S21310  [mRNA]  locus=s70:260090:261526:+ [translate_table: standard]